MTINELANETVGAKKMRTLDEVVDSMRKMTIKKRQDLREKTEKVCQDISEELLKNAERGVVFSGNTSIVLGNEGVFVIAAIANFEEAECLRESAFIEKDEGIFIYDAKSGDVDGEYLIEKFKESGYSMDKTNLWDSSLNGQHKHSVSQGVFLLGF